MSISSSVPLCCRAISELGEASIRPTRDPPPGRPCDWAEATLLLVQDRDRIAASLNDLVVHRLFSAGLALETVLRAAGLGHFGHCPARNGPGHVRSLHGAGRLLGAGENVRDAGQQGPTVASATL